MNPQQLTDIELGDYLAQHLMGFIHASSNRLQDGNPNSPGTILTGWWRPREEDPTRPGYWAQWQNPCNDIEKTRELEQIIHRKGLHWDYALALRALVLRDDPDADPIQVEWYLIHATPRQRCEAAATICPPSTQSPTQWTNTPSLTCSQPKT